MSDLDLKKIAAYSLERVRNSELPLKVRKAYHELHTAALNADLVTEMELVLGAIRKMPISESIVSTG